MPTRKRVEQDNDKVSRARAASGAKGGRATAKRGSGYFRNLSKKRTVFAGGRPRKVKIAKKET